MGGGDAFACISPDCEAGTPCRWSDCAAVDAAASLTICLSSDAAASLAGWIGASVALCWLSLRLLGEMITNMSPQHARNYPKKVNHGVYDYRESTRNREAAGWLNVSWHE